MYFLKLKRIKFNKISLDFLLHLKVWSIWSWTLVTRPMVLFHIVDFFIWIVARSASIKCTPISSSHFEMAKKFASFLEIRCNSRYLGSPLLIFRSQLKKISYQLFGWSSNVWLLSNWPQSTQFISGPAKKKHWIPSEYAPKNAFYLDMNV